MPFRRGTPCVVAGPSRPLSVTQLLLDISLARLLLTVAAPALGPFRASLRAWTLAWHLLLALRRFLLRQLGWLAAPPQAGALRQLGGGLLDVRRWHLAAGGRAGWLRPRVKLLALMHGKNDGSQMHACRGLPQPKTNNHLGRPARPRGRAPALPPPQTPP